MPDAAFFRRLGLFVDPGFLDAEVCALLREEIRPASKERAGITSKQVIDLEARRTQLAAVAPETHGLVSDRVQEVLPEIERHYSRRLRRQEGLQFLVYEPGDFFEPHRDWNEPDEGPPPAEHRRVSVVVFLNSEVDEPGPGVYSGGALTFYGLLGASGADRLGLPLRGEEGLLVAFRSELTHGVSPVIHGARYTVVTWFS